MSKIKGCRVEADCYAQACERLRAEPKTWLITGVAGVIGSNLLEALLKLDQRVIGLDNFSTGRIENLEEVKGLVSTPQWQAFHFHEDDIRNMQLCRKLIAGVDFVLHQAALGSVPRSIADPITSHQVNVDGFLNVLNAAAETKITRMVYAASSSTYGDHPALPKVKACIGRPLSPYAVTKYVNELYAEVYGRCYDLQSIGLRLCYFNVFGPRQNPTDAYAAVIPKWAAAMITDEEVFINGDGQISRDFCFTANVVQANLLAALRPQLKPSEVYNIAVGDRTNLNELFDNIKQALHEQSIHYALSPRYGGFRPGDVKHSQADIGKASLELGYRPTHSIVAGLHAAMPWYIDNLHTRHQGRLNPST